MPRPATLPLIPWKEIFDGGLPWEAWLAVAENPEQATRMRTIKDAAHMESGVRAVLAALPKAVHVIAIAEDWCGDVVRHAPLLAAMESASGGKLTVRFISRADHPEVFARFLTNGGEAIPKFVFLSADWVECGNWGPMPADCRKLIARGKASSSVGAARKRVAALYDADPLGEQVFRELLELAEIATGGSLQ